MKSLTKSYALLIPLCLAPYSMGTAQELPALDLPPLPAFGDASAAGLPPLPGEPPAREQEVTLPAIEVVGESEPDLPELPSFDNATEAPALPEPMPVAISPDLPELPALTPDVASDSAPAPATPAMPEIPDLVANDDPFADPDFDKLFEEKQEAEVKPDLPAPPPLPGIGVEQADGDDSVLPIGLPPIPTKEEANVVEQDDVKPVKQASPKKAKRNFSYKVQREPKTAAYYQRNYNRKNRHLPVAAYETDMDHAVFTAAAYNDVNGLRALLNAGRRLNMRNPQGDTPLITAVRANAMKTTRLLVARGANVHAQNRYGMSAIDIARQQRNQAALALLSPLVFAQR